MNKSKSAFAVQQHRKYRGKIQSALKCPIQSDQDMAVWYTPGVAAPCREIAARPDAVFELTNKGNTVAIVSDGNRIPGLGDIGPESGLPVMEDRAIAAATQLATVVQETGLRPNRSLPSMRDFSAYVRVAVATAMQAQVEGLTVPHKSAIGRSCRSAA